MNFPIQKQKILHFIRKLSKKLPNNSWSADGNWIVSVNHQFIKNYRISHARLINKSDLSKPMILIGFESDILIAVILTY